MDESLDLLENDLLENDLLEKGFQLAHFIIADRQPALDTLSGALNKLEARRTREKKRAYWRDKHLKRWITSITRSDADILQWLILFESDAWEKEHEASGNASARDMSVRYVKHLVQVTTALSSFYVNIGLSRLLYNYSGAETQRMYELIAERYIGTDQYRRAKSLLREKLELRFGRFIKSVKTPQGELRFEPVEDQGRWTQLVRECLMAFTPWSTAGVCLALPSLDSRAAPFERILPGKEHGKEEFDRIELNRCHVFIEPACYGRLTNWLRFRAPEQALALPHFFLDGDGDGDGSVNRENQPPTPPGAAPMTPEERRRLEESLATQAARRRRAKPEIIKVVIDGVERISVNLVVERERRFEVVEGARLIEVWTEEEGAPLLLATHLIARDESGGFVPFDLAMDGKGGARFLLTLVPRPASAEGECRGWITLRRSPTQGLSIGRGGSRFLSERFWVTPAHAWAAIAFLSLGWAASVAVYQRHLSAERIAMQRVEKELAAAKAARPSLLAISTYRLIPDELIVRGQKGLEAPLVFLPAQPALVSLQLPVGDRSRRFYRASLKLFSDQKEILTEDSLTASQTDAGPAVLFTIPAEMLNSNTDYAVYLEQANRAGKLEVVHSFMFHTQEK